MPLSPKHKKMSQKNYAVLICLLTLMVLFFGAAVIKFGATS
ncbi:MAG: hypothetical protein K0R02_74 [Rickettsiaceae bacterium]|jgi:hypothetical protein|nr:hypothetical protein [Rickettsiaceae bacterium]